VKPWRRAYVKSLMEGKAEDERPLVATWWNEREGSSGI